jgi:hypothetical protein
MLGMEMNHTVLMRREWAMPNANTFEIPCIGAFVKKYLRDSKASLDLFARDFTGATVTNDLNPNTKAAFHMEALEFLDYFATLGIKADLAIFDPPYSLEQCSRSYQDAGREVTQRDTQIFNRWTEHRDVLAHVLTDDAVVLSFGWNSQGMGQKNGFALEELLLVCHGAGHNDTICIAERRVQSRLFQNK